MRRHALLLIAIGLFIAADDKEDAVKKGRKELEGTWQALTYALDGVKAPEEDLKKITLSIDADGNATAKNDGKTFVAGTMKIDPSKNPKTIDISYTEGPPKGTISLGIYKIETETLTICRAPAGKDRPTEFSSNPGSGLTLMTYKREKK